MPKAMVFGRFRKKPVEVEALRWTGENSTDVLLFIGPTASYNNILNAIKIPTLEGDMWAFREDWIIKGVKGEFYPCKPDIFEETYEEL